MQKSVFVCFLANVWLRFTLRPILARLATQKYTDHTQKYTDLAKSVYIWSSKSNFLIGYFPWSLIDSAVNNLKFKIWIIWIMENRRERVLIEYHEINKDSLQEVEVLVYEYTGGSCWLLWD